MLGHDYEDKTKAQEKASRNSVHHTSKVLLPHRQTDSVTNTLPKRTRAYFDTCKAKQEEIRRD
jgi:hypothetical protein